MFFITQYIIVDTRIKKLAGGSVRQETRSRAVEQQHGFWNSNIQLSLPKQCVQLPAWRKQSVVSFYHQLFVHINLARLSPNLKVFGFQLFICLHDKQTFKGGEIFRKISKLYIYLHE